MDNPETTRGLGNDMVVSITRGQSQPADMRSPVDHVHRGRPTKFKIWYTHQVPGQAFEREVSDPAVGLQILDAIYDLALFQFSHNMIPDYANAGGVVYLDEDGDWVDYDPEDFEEGGH